MSRALNSIHFPLKGTWQEWSTEHGMECMSIPVLTPLQLQHLALVEPVQGFRSVGQSPWQPPSAEVWVCWKLKHL